MSRVWSAAASCKLADYADDENPSVNSSEKVVAQTETVNEKGQIQLLSFGQIAQKAFLERSDWILKIARRFKPQTKRGSNVQLSILFQFNERSCFLILLDGAGMPQYMDKADLVVRIDYSVFTKSSTSPDEEKLDHGRIHHGICGKVF